MLAIALLPISRETIVYGSADAGKTVPFDYLSAGVDPQHRLTPPLYKVHTSSANCNELMKVAGQRLGLKPHRVKNCTLYGPGDIEVHKGWVREMDRNLHATHINILICRITVFISLMLPEYSRTSPHLNQVPK